MTQPQLTQQQIAEIKTEAERRIANFPSVIARDPENILSLIATLEARDGFQSEVNDWMQACFGAAISADKQERNHRFLEEALELVQAIGCTKSEASQLVDYVYGRDQGEVNQEVGGVMVTLAALCLANDLDMASAGNTELARVWTKIEKIRAKQAAKPKHTPLPVAATLEARDAAFGEMLAALKEADLWVFSRMRNKKLVMDEHRHSVDEAIQYAIARAERVK